MRISATVIHSESTIIQLRDESNRSLAQLKVPQKDQISVAEHLLMGVVSPEVLEQVMTLVRDNAKEAFLPKPSKPKK